MQQLSSRDVLTVDFDLAQLSEEQVGIERSRQQSPPRAPLQVVSAFLLLCCSWTLVEDAVSRFASGSVFVVLLLVGTERSSRCQRGLPTPKKPQQCCKLFRCDVLPFQKMGIAFKSQYQDQTKLNETINIE